MSTWAQGRSLTRRWKVAWLGLGLGLGLGFGLGLGLGLEGGLRVVDGLLCHALAE